MNAKILSLEEANNGEHTILPTGGENKKIVISAEFVNPKFKEYLVLTTTKELEDSIETIKARPLEENKLVWVKILRNLNQYDIETLNQHFTNNTKEWNNWSADCVLWYCYNSVIFKKGIPVMLYDDLPKEKLIKNF